MTGAGLISLHGRVAVVTGGGAGIGRAIAIAYAAAGADVVIGDIVPERGEEAAARVREQGARAVALPTDVTDTAQVRALIEQAGETFGGLDILVNNAGGTGRRAFADHGERSWRRHIDLNFVSMLAATSAAIPPMIAAARGGAIVNVSSIEGSRAAPGFAVYAACKAAMNNFTRTMALELADHGIRINAIAPDYTETPGLRGQLTGPVDPAGWAPRTPAQDHVLDRRIPLGRGGIDTECANVALFLASPMSSYVTGTVIPVDGGVWASAGWVRDRAGQWVQYPDPPEMP
ncbi:MAG: SDR family oxidoreductase [Sphingomonas sp.]